MNQKPRILGPEEFYAVEVENDGPGQILGQARKAEKEKKPSGDKKDQAVA